MKSSLLSVAAGLSFVKTSLGLILIEFDKSQRLRHNHYRVCELGVDCQQAITGRPAASKYLFENVFRPLIIGWSLCHK